MIIQLLTKQITWTVIIRQHDASRKIKSYLVAMLHSLGTELQLLIGEAHTRMDKMSFTLSKAVKIWLQVDYFSCDKNTFEQTFLLLISLSLSHSSHIIILCSKQ